MADYDRTVNNVTLVQRTLGGKYLLKSGETTDTIDATRLANKEYVLNRGSYDPTSLSARTYNTYTIPTVDASGNPTTIQGSILQLVMSICLKRASEVETNIVDLMEKISKNTAEINALTLVYSKLVAKYDGKNNIDDYLKQSTEHPNGLLTEEEYKQLSDYMKQAGLITSDLTETKIDNLLHYTWGLGVVSTGDYLTPAVAKAYIDDMDSKLDSLNSLSQELLVELQNLTAKRDETYDLCSALTKSISTTTSSNIANLR